MLVRSEGGLLPGDVLVRIAGQDRDLGGLTDSDYHLAPRERVREAIAQSWARLTTSWEVFSAEREEAAGGDTTGRLTRERWTLPLFTELGYGRLVKQPGPKIEGKSFPVFCQWQHSPIHLVGAGVALDRRTPNVDGAAEQSPHSLVQELLNRSPERLWGIVTNGLSLRLLRDNVTLTRQAYVEFDVEAIFAEEAFEDFALLWLCCHQSRLEADDPLACWLERWMETAQRDGTRALTDLRMGVESAIESLGQGFLSQRANTDLQAALRDGRLDGPAYYRELLRLVYRLLFLFVAEDRDALLLSDDDSVGLRLARRRYVDHYSTRRLRTLAGRRRGGRAFDLYEQVKLVSGWLHDGGQPALALPPLGSALWNPATTAHVSAARLSNQALLDAVHHLAFMEDGRRPVDFRHLGAEELGSVYESLLELHPVIERESATFALTTAAGHERKQTGSYYTPTQLIGSLLESALDPVIERAARSADPEQALLDLTVCDPACGSGHFLIAAANRIAKRLAAVREGDPQPAPEAIRHALRDVVARCIHGVDSNPMAVELCKVSLWLEALEPGRPLSFLDDRILLGNSLLGTAPALVEAGVPDDAFKPLLGDGRDTVREHKRRNAAERKGRQTAMGLGPPEDATALTEAAIVANAIADDSPAGVARREAAYTELLASAERERLRLAADAWIAAFVAPRPDRPVPTRDSEEALSHLREQISAPITQQVARLSTDVVYRAATLGRDGLSVAELGAVESEVERYRPLHWHVAFPAIFRAGEADAREQGWVGGFDCVLGNPPWERVKLQETEFFAGVAPEIAAAKSKAARERMIDALESEDTTLFTAFQDAKRRAEGDSHLMRSTGRYPLCGRGDVNTYAVFAEAMRAMLAPTGRLGVIVPTGIATDDTTKLFFADLMQSGSLVSLYDFENAVPVFPGVHRSYKFCLLTAAGTARRSGEPAEFSFFAHRVEDLTDPERRFELTAEDIALLNPNTRTCPVFRTRRDAEITKGIYQRVPVLVRKDDLGGNPWGIRFSTMFHMSNDSSLLRTRGELEAAGWTLKGNVFAREGERMLPLYEGRFGHQFNHRFASQPRGELRETSRDELADPTFVVEPQYWVTARDFTERIARRDVGSRACLLGFRRVARNTDERTCIAAVLPWVPTSYGWILITGPGARELLLLVALINSFALDYALRNALTQSQRPAGHGRTAAGADSRADRGSWCRGSDGGRGATSQLGQPRPGPLGAGAEPSGPGGLRPRSASAAPVRVGRRGAPPVRALTQRSRPHPRILSHRPSQGRDEVRRVPHQASDSRSLRSPSRADQRGSCRVTRPTRSTRRGWIA